MNIDQIAASLISKTTLLISGATARWIDTKPSERQTIYYANHSSHLDAVVLWSSLPKKVKALVRPVAAKEYWEKTALRKYLAARVFNAVLIERPSVKEKTPRSEIKALAYEAIRSMTEALGTENSLIIFPEGTRGDGNTIGPFKSGLYNLAKNRPDVDLVPVYMQNLSRILPKGELFPIPLLSSITFGAPLRLIETETKREFMDRARTAMINLTET